MNKKIRLAVLFGGRSTEHEVSLVSGSSVLNAADKDKYELVPVGITKEGVWKRYNGPLEGILSGTGDKGVTRSGTPSSGQAPAVVRDESSAQPSAGSAASFDTPSASPCKPDSSGTPSEAEAPAGAGDGPAADLQRTGSARTADSAHSDPAADAASSCLQDACPVIPDAWEADADPIDPWRLPELCDFVLPILHGKNGEDGTVQGLLELLDIPYGGCGVLGSAVAMDKTAAKKIFESCGLPQTPYIDFTSADIGPELTERINRELEYPLFVKPVNLGSSVGISKVNSPGELMPAIEYAAKFDSRFCVEHAVNRARELEVSVMGNDELFIGRVGEIVPKQSFYTYDAKYNDGSSELLIPAPISGEEEQTVRSMAAAAYRALSCQGFSRCDFLMDGDTHQIYINEINTIPGFTEISMFPKLCIAAGMTYPEIIDRIVELGYERHAARNRR